MVLGVASPAFIRRSCVLFVHHRRSRAMERALVVCEGGGKVNPSHSSMQPHTSQTHSHTGYIIIIQGVLQAGGPSAAIHRRGLFSSARRRKRYTRSMYPSFGVPSHRAKWPRGCNGANGGLHVYILQGHTNPSHPNLPTAWAASSASRSRCTRVSTTMS